MVLHQRADAAPGQQKQGQQNEQISIGERRIPNPRRKLVQLVCQDFSYFSLPPDERGVSPVFLHNSQIR